MIVIYVTFPNKEEAKKLSNLLLEKKLIACVNTFEMEAASKWGGKIEWIPEVVALFKTRAELFEKVKQFVIENHPYEVPCIFSLRVLDVVDKYDKWVKGETE